MTRTIIIAFIFTGVVFGAFSQSGPQRFFPEGELITCGTFYYPEHWDPSQWERDMKKMAEMGFEYVHMAEFSWAFLEPEEQKYEFGWLDRAIDLAEKYGLKVILGTPSATPPAWMGIKYPEIYLVDAEYDLREHGSRQNVSIVNPKFQELTQKLVTAMGKRYGSNEAVMGWQIGNEPCAKADYSPSAQAAFRAWLEENYQTIDSLNMAWGTAFWSMRYGSFDEIRIPNAGSIYWWGTNPHALLDFKRFTADVQADFINMQAATLRPFIAEDQFITTNYVAVTNDADPRLSVQLDFPAYTTYPNGGSRNLGAKGFRLGDPRSLLRANDYFRPIDGVTGVMEIQPGQVNWGAVNPLLMPGAVRMWLWHAFSMGSRFASSYRFRQINYAVEQYHAGMIKTDGVSLAQGGKEYVQFIDEIAELRKRYNPGVLPPAEIAARKTAIVWSHENMWGLDRQPQSRQWNTWDHVMKYHEILKSFGAPVDYISEQDELSAYPFVIVPAYQMVDDRLVEKWRKYVEGGGQLVLTCRTGVKDRNGHFWRGEWAAPIHGLTGAEVTAYDMLFEDSRARVRAGEKMYHWNNWADLLEPDDPACSRAVYADQFYAGQSAVVMRKLGKGTVAYIGVDTDDAMLEKDMLKAIFAQKGVSIESYPDGVFVHWRDGFFAAVNYSSETHSLELPEEAKVLIGDPQLGPADVLVWQ